MRKSIRQTLLSALSVIILSCLNLTLSAQNTSSNCLDFDDYDRTGYETLLDDIIQLSFPHIDAQVSDFPFVVSNNFSFGTGNYLATQGITFEAVDPNQAQLSRISFNFVTAQSQLPILVNNVDSALVDLNSYSSAIDITSDIVFSVDSLVSEGVFRKGRATLQGGILENFYFGLEGETAIDDLCYEFFNGDCLITNVSVIPLPCTANGTFDLLVDADHRGRGDTVIIEVDGINYGVLPYASLPTQIGPFDRSAGSRISVVLTDELNPDCQFQTVLESPGCGCSIEDVTATASPCDSDDQYTVSIDFDPVNPEGDNFIVIGGGLFYGIYPYASLPLELGPFAPTGQDMEFNVFDATNPACIGFARLEAVECEADCEISNITADFTGCDSLNYHFITLDFDYIHPDGSLFRIYDEIGRLVTRRVVNALPVSTIPVSDLNRDGTGDLRICLGDNANLCCETLSLDLPDCPNPCLFVEYAADAVCVNDSFFTINLSLQTADQSDSFSVLINDFLFDVFPYDVNASGITELELGPFFAGIIGSYTIQVIDNSNPNCQVQLFVREPDCSNECRIQDLVVEAEDCEPDGTFYVHVDFDYTNASDQFNLYVDSRLVGSYRYGQQFYRVGPFNGNGQTIQFTVSDSLDFDCEARFELIAPDCEIDSICDIRDLVVTPGQCTSDSTYALTIDFEDTNVGSFDVWSSRGELVGTFSTNSLPLTIDYPSYGWRQESLLICQANNQFCCARTTYFAPICISTGNECRLFPQEISTQPCDSNGQFLVDLQFFGVNTSDSVNITSANTDFGWFSVQDQPIQIGPFDGNGTIYDVLVTDERDPDCQALFTVGPFFCDTTIGCTILEFEAFAGDCTSDSSYNLVMHLEFGGNRGDTVIIYNADRSESIIAHVDGRPIVWSDFPSNGQTVDQVTICEFGRPDCCVTTQFDTPDCTGSCDIRQITAQPLGCDSRGNFLVELDFESINTSDSFFVVDQGNNRYGAFSYNNLPIRLGPFAGDGVTEYSFAVIDEELRSCAGDIIIGTINCDSNSVCGIRDINVQVEDCTSNTSFSLVLDLLFNGPTGDTLLLRGSTSGYQQAFTKGQLPLRISNYPYNPNIRGEELIVCDGDNPNCCVRSFFEYPDCGGNQVCRIEQLTATPGECTSDSTYKLTIDMIYSGNPTDSFVVYRDPPNVIGAWTVDQLPLTIDNFSSGNAPADAILVCFEFPSCCESIGWAVPDCSDYSNDCELGQMTATAGPCDANGRFMVDIDFDRFNTSDSFDLAYQRVISRFSYTDLPVSVGSFEADGRTVYEFFVTDKDNPDCVTGIELGPVDCDTIVECQISNFVLTAGDCLTDSSYNLTVDFDVVNPGSRTFTLTSNGQDIGSFPIDELPLTVEYFGGQDSLDIIALCIDNQPNCCTRGVVQRPDCLNNDCQIRSLEAYPLDCNGDGTYSLIVDMTIWNADSDSFLLSSDAGFIGTFAYDDLPLFLPDFESNGDSIDFLYAFDQIDTICEKETFFPALLCGQCDISDLEAEIVDCEDGSFYVQLDFDFGNVGNIGFQVIGNGQRYGNYDYSDLPVLLGPFRSDPPNRRLDFTVFDLVNFDCRAETALRAPDCPEGEDIEVWPGDANRDNISNHFDLLELGVAFGHTGTRRPTLSSDWGGYSSNDWDLDFASGHNYKHADCNGDGVIDQKDIQVIEDNYGQSHGPIAPYDWPRGDENDPPVLVDLEAAAPRSGQSFRAPLVVGLPSQPVDSIYGIAFTLQFGGSTTIPLNTRVLVEDSWLGKKDETMVSIDRTFAGNGIIQVAITRIDQRNVSGHGQVASFIGIIDNISGRAAMEVEVVAIKAITFEQAPVLLMGQNSAIDIITNVKIPDNTDMLRLYPNPATQVLKIHDMGQAGMNRIRIYNSLGQLVREVDPADDMESVDVSQWAPGIYFAEVQFGVRVVTKKFKVSR